MASTWWWISRRREAEILERELRHLSHIKKVAENTLRLVEAVRAGDASAVEEAYKQVKEAERSADRVKDEIIEDLAAGLFHPIDREELLRLVLVSDDIAAHLNSGARRLLVYVRTGSDKLPDEAIDGMKEIVEIANEAIDKLAEALHSLRRNPQRSVELAREVERLEERADEIRSRTEELLVAWCNTHGRPGTCIVANKALESFETATDKCEDTADVVRSIAVLSR
ncbi:MAG: DUF47 family protein [Desulfurococcales archaeon]|nr:DUF47 family protein [Desulfurococcales archaeon]